MREDTILVVNAGSSSLKLALIEAGSEALACSVLLEALNSPQSALTLKAADGERVEKRIPDLSHQSGLDEALKLMEEVLGAPLSLAGAGHRVVHGGPHFSSAQRITPEVISKIEACRDLAPLHNPWALEGIRSLAALYPELPQVVVFDTAFHQSIPRRAYLYGLPWELYEDHKVRRYGFHGTSYHYLTGEAARRLGREVNETNLLCAHLGNGCSAVAVKDGKAVDTTMGITPLEGLVMGSRSGDVDPSLFLFLKQKLGYSVEDTTTMLNQRSGLLGISGRSNDMREVSMGVEDGDQRCVAALEVFCHRLARAMCGLAASLERIDAIVFSGGIGENSAEVRARVLTQMSLLGARVDQAKNMTHGVGHDGCINEEGALPAMVIQTNEELMIARESMAAIA